MISHRRHALIAAAVVLTLSGCTAQAPDSHPTPPPPSATPAPTTSLEDTDPIDLGSRPGAMGDVTVDDRGVPVSYTVADGDTADLIRARFDIWWDQLARDGARLVRAPEIYPGDVLTFLPHDPVFEDN